MKVRQGPGGVSDVAVELFKVLFLVTLAFEESGARTLYVEFLLRLQRTEFNSQLSHQAVHKHLELHRLG